MDLVLFELCSLLLRCAVIKMLLKIDNYFHRTARYPENIRFTSTKCRAFLIQPMMANFMQRLVRQSKLNFRF